MHGMTHNMHFCLCPRNHLIIEPNKISFFCHCNFPLYCTANMLIILCIFCEDFDIRHIRQLN